MTREVSVQPLTAEAFAPFGDVLESRGTPSVIINQGKCGRFHDLAMLDFEDARAGISIFESEARSFPYTLDLMERHPLGTQAFLPMTEYPFLVIVAEDAGGQPAEPKAFLAASGQGVNYHRNVWHGVLTPLSSPGRFAVIDRIGEGNNLEEFWFPEPWVIKE